LGWSLDMDATRKERYEKELAALRLEKKRLEGAMAFYEYELGIAASADAPGEPTSDADKLPAVLAAPGPDPRVLVGAGEFWGESSTKAAARLLEKSGRSHPLKTREILAAILKGGVRLGGKTPEGSLY